MLNRCWGFLQEWAESPSARTVSKRAYIVLLPPVLYFLVFGDSLLVCSKNFVFKSIKLFLHQHLRLTWLVQALVTIDLRLEPIFNSLELNIEPQILHPQIATSYLSTFFSCIRSRALSID